MSKNKVTFSKKQLQEIANKLVSQALQEVSLKQPVKLEIRKSQLQEGIRKLTKKILENNMPMLANVKNENMDDLDSQKPEDSKRTLKSLTFGMTPPVAELDDALRKIDGWQMNLKGSEAASFRKAMQKAKIDPRSAASQMNTGTGMEKVLKALADSGDEIANSLGSSVMGILGWEWV